MITWGTPATYLFNLRASDPVWGQSKRSPGFTDRTAHALIFKHTPHGLPENALRGCRSLYIDWDFCVSGSRHQFLSVPLWSVYQTKSSSQMTPSPPVVKSTYILCYYFNSAKLLVTQMIEYSEVKALILTSKLCAVQVESRKSKLK